MDSVMFFVFLFCFGALVTGLIKPSVLKGFYKGATPTRKKLALHFGLASLSSFIAFGNLVDSPAIPASESQAVLAEETPAFEAASAAVPTMQSSATPEPTVVPTLIPTPQSTPKATPTPPALPVSAPTGQSVYYKNCTAAWAAGVAPLYRGEPGYAPHLDGDDDGVACEKRPR